ncbi:c-type cytochrome [Methylacidimicrobium sp. B4]|uniref:c-type cytochrome n=1 Tax=Methylacidimicrobium sp. B4 TaxID=2796139 RepID=UPI001F5C3993|nr:c-type cytochrome [Methylacidimicrobium sp. B4]
MKRGKRTTSWTRYLLPGLAGLWLTAAGAQQPPAAAPSTSTPAGPPPISAAGGAMKNPYTDNPQMIAEGRKLWFSRSCNGCHGGMGGGGMCPPVINDTWVYGSDDKTLFELIKNGSVELQKKGYTRIGRENVVAPMPPFGSVMSDDEIWKVIAYVRSIYHGDPKLRNW